jgi:large subunit ribosomal protein L20
MPRSVNAVASRKRRKKILDAAKGFFGARRNVYTAAKNTLEKGMAYAYRDRRAKKRGYRRLWIARINAAVRTFGLSYSRFIHLLDKNEVALNRKVLADLALNHPDTFANVVKSLN